MKLTLTFYQYPQAQAEIDFWVQSQGDRISSSSYNNDTKEQAYYLPGEVLVCLPLNDGPGFKGLDTTKVLKWCDKFTYYKTLIFGKVNSKQLTKLLKIQNYLEKTYE